MLDLFVQGVSVQEIYVLGCKARIPPEITFALATQHKEKVHKQEEIDMDNANPNANLPNATIFHRALGLVLGTLGLVLGTFAAALGTLGLALGLWISTCWYW